MDGILAEETQQLVGVVPTWPREDQASWDPVFLWLVSTSTLGKKGGSYIRGWETDVMILLACFVSEGLWPPFRGGGSD